MALKTVAAAAMLSLSGPRPSAPAGPQRSPRLDQAPRPSSALPASAVSPERDLTARFLELHESVKAGKAGPLPEAAKEARYLLIGGFYSNQEPSMFDGNRRRLEELGLDAVRVPIHSEGRRKANMEAIERAVAASDKPVVILGHSWGGAMAHDLYRAKPEFAAKVERLVLLQSPLNGTHSAANAVRFRPGRAAAYWWGRFWYKANLFRTLAELSPRGRGRLMSGLPAWRPGELDRVYALRTHASPRTILGLAGRAAFFGSNAAHDTVVPLESMKVPGSWDVVLAGVDHNQTVVASARAFKRALGLRPHPVFSPGNLTEALLRLIYERRADASGTTTETGRETPRLPAASSAEARKE